MSISEIIIEDGCISCELCEQACPEVFEVEEVAVIKPGVDFNVNEDKIREAAESCPVSIISVS